MNNGKLDSRGTEETRAIEAARAEFPDSKAYRYNSGAIRVRVIDPRFQGLAIEDRDRLVAPILDQFPDDIQRQIFLLLTLTPEEAKPESFGRHSLLNLEFEVPILPLL